MTHRAANGKKKSRKCFNGCGRKVRFRLICGPCRRKARKADRDMRRNRRSKNAKLPGKR